jgi:hypothetical protein
MCPVPATLIRLVRTTITPGVTTDVLNVERLADASPWCPWSREVLLELPPVFQGVRMDNIEAISWGHTLDNGHRTLVLVADNNFSARQRSLFMVFELQQSADRSAGPGR